LKLTIEDEFEKCFKLQKESGIYSAIFSEAVCIISKYPKKIYRDERFRLHNTKESSIDWGYSSEQTKFNCYYIHGRNIPETVFTSPIIKEKFINETNEEIRGAYYEILGEDKVFELLGAEAIDKQIIIHQNGDIEPIILYKTKENLVNNQPLAWVKYVCPSTQAPFLISCSPEHINAKEAAVSQSIFTNQEYSFNFRT
jgi:hypothetical protein